jgi:hypothetical protein
MRFYTITMTDADGKEVSRRHLRIIDEPEYIKSEEYRASICGRELFIDALLHSKVKCASPST